MPYVSKDIIDEYLGDLLKLRTPYSKVKVESPDLPLKDEKEVEGILKFLRKVCKVIHVYNSGHPLGRGFIAFSCHKRVDVSIHGDWSPERTYVKIWIMKSQE